MLCLDNNKYPASLEVRKIYLCISDPDAESHDMIRVIDESGEDYLYPASIFVPIEIPQQATKAFAHKA